ncbi:MAG: hypothetical protein JWO08_3365 [Verrucomicrobiaceae bacterium]|nr:hypothetical protein [Verrucomicrobiaceae bacterium]
MTLPTPTLRQRKVLHFITGIGGGGAENFLRGLATTMRDSRWQTVIVVVRVRPHETFANELRTQGCTIHDLNADALLKPQVWMTLRRLIQQERPDVVQTWMHHADFIGGLAAWTAGYRNIVWGVRAMEMHRNPGDSDLKISLFRGALRFTAPWLPKKIISNSTVAINVHVTMGYPRRKFVWVPNGVNSERFSPRPEVGRETRESLKIAGTAPVVGFVGRFHPVKDLALFFEAAALLQVQYPDLHLLLVGGTEDELYPAARKAFEKLPSRDQVRFVPFGSGTDRYYPAFTLFSLCSESEAFPNVVLEAMASGVPCATTNAGDCEAMLKDLGEVVQERTGGAMAAAWSRLLALSEAERAALAVKSRDRAINEYSLERAAQRFEEVYDSLSP